MNIFIKRKVFNYHKSPSSQPFRAGVSLIILMIFVPWRTRIIAITVTDSKLSISSLNTKLRFLVPSNLSGNANRFSLCWYYLSRSNIICALNSPIFSTSYYKLIFFHILYLLCTRDTRMNHPTFLQIKKVT